MNYYIDGQGRYLGGWDANPPAGARAVAYAPQDARQVWDGEQWGQIPNSTPERVTMRQARQSMLATGILGQVDSIIAAMPGDEGESARIDWNHAQDVRRDWPLIGEIGPQIGLTEQQIDDLFLYAATIPQ